MAISNAELISLYGQLGIGKMPVTGGPAGNFRSSIAQTTPIEAIQNTVTPATGTMYLASIYLNAKQTITNINFISVAAESGGSHLWFALYDDGRGSSSAGQLALLGQTADQTGAAAFGSNTNLGLSLLAPYTTTYNGTYYVAFQYVGSSLTLWGNSLAGMPTSVGAFYNGIVASVSSGNAPNPSGSPATTTIGLYAYLS